MERRDQQDRAQLESAMEAYGTGLLRTAMLLLKDPRDAQEAVADTFLRYYQSAEQFRGESRLKTYLTRILINCCRQKQRSAWLRRVVLSDGASEEPEWAGGGHPEGSVIRREWKESLAGAVRSLEQKEKEVILLHYYHEFSIKEISGILGRKEGTVKCQLSRGRDSLRKKIRKEDFDELFSE